MPEPQNNHDRLRAAVASGAGQAAHFTQLDWVREQLCAAVGVDPYPGTLNLRIEDPDHQAAWLKTANHPHSMRLTGQGEHCDAWVLPARINDAIPVAVLQPDVAGYAANQIEIVASIGLREHLQLADADEIELEISAPHEVSAVIFDIDGTLLNSLDGYRVAVSRATAAYGWEVTPEIVRKALNGNHAFWDLLIPDPALRTETFIAELRAETMRQWPAALAECVDLIPGIEAMLADLESRDIRLAIFTGSAGESMPPLKESGLLDRFECIVTGKDVANRKPDPEGLLICLEKLGLEASEVAYVGDSCADVGASRAAGMASISVLTGAGDPASLALAGSDRIIRSVAQLPAALML